MTPVGAEGSSSRSSSPTSRAASSSSRSWAHISLNAGLLGFHLALQQVLSPPVQTAFSETDEFLRSRTSTLHPTWTPWGDTQAVTEALLRELAPEQQRLEHQQGPTAADEQTADRSYAQTGLQHTGSMTLGVPGGNTDGSEWSRPTRQPASQRATANHGTMPPAAGTPA